MNSRSFHLPAFPLCIALLLGGCQKPEDKTAQESVRLLKEIKTAVSATHRKGEAFLVLKSDAVVYMADMEIICFRSDLQQHFTQWQQDWNTAYQAMLKENVAKDPALQAKLKEADASIAEVLARTSNLKQEATDLVANLAGKLEKEKETLLAEQARTSAALKEYQQIIAPFDERMKTQNAKFVELKTEQEKLAIETVERINKHIVEAQLKVPKLTVKSGEELFDTDRDFSQNRPSNKRFLAKIDRQSGSYSFWHYFKKIPQELENTSSEAMVKDAYKKWTAQEAASDSLASEWRAEKEAKDAALIPWQNRHGIERNKGAVLVAAHEQQTAKIKGITERITRLRAGGTEGAALVEKAVQEGREKVETAVAELRKEREAIVEDATKAVTRGLKRQHHAKFLAVLAKQAATTVRTGSKGDFTVPADIAYVFAERKRDNGEHTLWFRRVDSKSPDIRLSNSNSLDLHRDDMFWMFDLKFD